MSWLTNDLSPEESDALLDAWHTEAVKRQMLERVGVCFHLSSLSTAANGVVYYPPQAYLEPGEALCLDCGKTWPSVEEQDLEVEDREAWLLGG